MDRISTPRRPGDSTGNAFRVGAVAHKRQVERERKLAAMEAQELAEDLSASFDWSQEDQCGCCGGPASQCRSFR
jgi:hypothetical protein